MAVIVVSSGCGQQPQIRGSAGGSDLPPECEGDASHCEVLTSFRGVNVYRNIGTTGFCTAERCTSPQNRYGTRWQCVELFNRFFARQFGIDPVAGDAKDLFVRAGAISGLDPRPNGGEHPPAPGDALVFDGTRTGHVAIITEVTGGRVHVVEQNAPGDGTNSHAYDPITRTVSAPPATVLGWIHAT